jgi:hypothetical protein
MCRSLYVLERGELASKPDAARRALETQGKPWKDLIEAAGNWKVGMEFHSMKEVSQFIHFTLARWGLTGQDQ